MPPRTLRLGALAGTVHLALDALTARFPWTTPPYLLVDYASDAFRDLLATNRVGVSVAASLVNAAIAVMVALAAEQARRRFLVLFAALAGAWVVSGGTMMLVYMDVPVAVAACSLAAGLPRAALLGWLLDRVLGRRAAGQPDREAGAGAGG
jgi:hypothetical protein